MKTMKDYHDLYLKCAVLLLADVFRKFRNNSLKIYRVCPKHYLSASALSWDAVLNMTKKWNLNLLQILTCTYSSKKIWEVGFLILAIDIVKPTISILNLMSQIEKSYDLHANNSYGHAMSKFLPTSSFKWTDPKKFDLNKYTSNSSKGCVLKVDLEYPKELQELHNDYPLAPDKIEIKREMSDYQLQIFITSLLAILKN